MAISPDDFTDTGRPVVGAVEAAVEALADSMPERLWALTEAEIAQSMRMLGVLSESVGAHLAMVLAEAKRRSLGSGEGWGPVDWARAMAPGLSTRELLDLDAVATAAAADEVRLSDVVAAVAVATGGQLDGRGEVQSHGSEGALPVGKAAQIVRFHTSIRGMADPAQLADATDELLYQARGHDGISERDLAVAVRHAGEVMRPDRLVENDADVRRAHRSLVKGRGPVGLSRYTLLLDEEGAAIVDAAVDALAKPRPDADSGEHDPRTPAARRADALLDLVARAVGAPDGVPRQARTSLVVTIGLDVLQGRCRGAGLTPAGDVLTPGTVRRMACDAQVIPVVLGSRGEVLDQGMARRLFDRAQIRHLWLRDRHCTFPGCSKPAGWSDAHHLIHWADDGPTDVWNAALLCRAHHTIVHRHGYAGQVIDGPHGQGVAWDLTPGSYDTRVAAWRAAGAPTGPTGPPELPTDVPGRLTEPSDTSDAGPPRP